MLSEKILCRVKDNALVKKYMNGEFTDKIYFLNAEGGYGKSTSLKALYYYLVEQGTQANNHIVPIFIDVKQLVEFGEKGSAGNMPRPIEKYIVKHYCGADSDPNESLLGKVVNLFSKNNAPKFQNDYTYCIFVDAINEVNDRLKGIIVDEIKQMSESDSVKFFISSRINESSLPDDTVKYKLLPLDEEKIRVYLDKNFGKTGEKVDISRINDSLVDILRVPMYLSVFRKTYDEKTPYPDIYEAKTVRKADILDSFIQKLLDDNKGKERSANKAVIEFVVKYFLPALAFKMYNSNLSMQFSDKDFRKLRNNFDYFDSILVPDEYLTAFNANNTGIKSVCLNFGIVTFVNGYYAFTHQNWRDLFVAKHIINCMNAEKLDELETPISENVRQFIGELIREHKDGCGYSKDYMDKSDEEKARKSECDFEDKNNLEGSASPIEDFLQKHNLKTQCPLSAIATKNLIEIMKTSRNGNITAKYDDLDLKYVFFYKVNMQKSTFNGTKLYSYNFIPPGHIVAVNSVSFSPDGTKIVSGSDDNTIRIWDVKTGLQIGKPLTGHASFVNSVSFSPDGTKIVSGSDDETIRIWDTKTGTQIGEPLTEHTSCVNSVSFSPDGTKIASGSNDKTIRIWDVKTGLQIGKPLTGHTSRVTSVSFSPDGTKIVSGSDDGSIRIWDAETGAKLCESHTSSITSVSFSPDGTKIVSGSFDDTIRVWDAETGLQIGEPLSGHEFWVNSVVFSPDSKQIASGSIDGTIRIWDVKTSTQIGKFLTGHTSFITSVSFSPDGTKIVSGSYEGTIRIWDVEKGMQIVELLTGSTVIANSVTFSPDGTKIVSGSNDRTIRIWDAQTGAQIGKPLVGHADYVKTVSFSPDNTKLVSGSRDKTIRIWDVKTGTQLGVTLIGHINIVNSVSFAPDGTKIVSGSDDGTIRIWDVETGVQLGKLYGGSGFIDNVRSVSFSPNSKKMVSGSDDRTIRIWDAQTGAQIGKPLAGHTSSVNSVSFSPDGTKIVSGSDDGTIRIWNVQTGAQIGEPLTGHTSSVNSVSFSPDGTKIISGSYDRTIRIWNVQTGLQIGKPLTGHTNYVKSVSISPDSKKIVSGSDDGTIRIWNLEDHMCTICKTMLSCVLNCDFRNANYEDYDENEFYGIIYSNGGIVKNEFVPKPVPFEFSDKIKRKEKI